MNPYDAAAKAIAAYLEACPENWGGASCLRVLLGEVAREYAKASSGTQAYEALAGIALDTFNEHATLKGVSHG